MTVRTLRQESHRLFAGQDVPQPSPTPLLDCECLLSHILRTTRSKLLARDDRELTPEELSQYREAAEKRRKGLPVAYITGTKEFFGMEFSVTQDVLIPKPDTELLVEKALEYITVLSQALPEASALEGSPRPLEVCDMCTGSGCVAIAVLANTGQNIRVTAVDISEAALKAARENARRLLSPEKQRAITFVQSDLFAKFSHSAGSEVPAAPLAFDLALCNPPYVPSEIARTLLSDGRSEPLLALDGGADGLDCIRVLIDQAAEHLKPQGCLLLEAGEYNIAEAHRYLSNHGFTDILEYIDMGGLPRVLGTRNGKRYNP